MSLPCGGTNCSLSKVSLGKAPGRQQSCLNVTWKPKQMVGMALKTDTQEEGLQGGRGAALATAGSFPSQAPHQKGVQKMSQPSAPPKLWFSSALTGMKGSAQATGGSFPGSIAAAARGRGEPVTAANRAGEGVIWPTPTMHNN